MQSFTPCFVQSLLRPGPEEDFSWLPGSNALPGCFGSGVACILASAWFLQVDGEGSVTVMWCWRWGSLKPSWQFVLFVAFCFRWFVALRVGPNVRLNWLLKLQNSIQQGLPSEFFHNLCLEHQKCWPRSLKHCDILPRLLPTDCGGRQVIASCCLSYAFAVGLQRVTTLEASDASFPSTCMRHDLEEW